MTEKKKKKRKKVYGSAERFQQEKGTSSRKGDKPTQEWIYELRFVTLKLSLNYKFASDEEKQSKRGIKVKH